MLSDWLGLPNLRRKAIAYLRARTASVFGQTAEWLKTTPPRERRIYLIYGLLAWSYSFWLFGLIASWVGSFLVEQYQAWGFAFFGALLLGVFRAPVRRSITLVNNQFNSPRGWVRGLKRTAKLLAALAVVTAALFFWKMELKVAGEFTVLPIHNADVRAEVEGIIQEVYRDEGDSVSQGELIVRLADRDCRAELRKVKAEIDEKQAKLRMFRAGTRAEEIELARTAVAKADERLRFARHQLERDKTLFDQELLSRKDFELTEEQLSVRQKEWEEAKDQLQVRLAGSRPEEIEGLEAELRRLGGQQSYLEEQLELLTITSPVSGVVTTRKLKEKIGQHVTKGDLIAKVHEFKTVTADIAVPEKEIADVKPGQKVVLKARAHPLMGFQGIVTAIAPIATKQEDWRERTVLVTTQLDNPSLLLKPEMSGMAKIYCGQRRVAELLARRFVRYLRVEFWSWW
jgi:multidrug resistance efflux pump